ncbi:MAG: 6-bladed beta-propeller [Bacteroidia bacterium]|nr:6-bladed beta-propeller [Bacteroidia bacterium]
MKIIKNIFDLIVILILVSCNNNHKSEKITNNSHEIYTIDSEDEEKVFNWYQRIELVNIIQLETNSSSVIGKLAKGFVMKDKIFLADYRNSNLIVFDNNGKFLFKVGEKGKGSRKYMDLKDFMPVDNIIYLLDNKIIHSYNISNGDYKSFINIKTSGINPTNFLIYNSNSYYLWESNPQLSKRGDEKYRLQKIEDGKIKANYFKYDFMSMDGNRFYRSIQETYNIRPTDGGYVIYKIKNDSISISFELDFKNKTLPIDYFLKNPSRKNNAYLLNEYFKNVQNIFETNNYIYFSCVGPKAVAYEGFINKNTNEIKFGKWNLLNPQIFYSDDDYFYGYFEPSILLEESLDKSRNDFFDTIKVNLKNLKMMDNIIIVKFSLNDH